MPPARKSKDKEYASARRRRSEQEAAARAPAEDRDAAREAAAARRSAALALAAERCGETVPGRETAPSRALVAPQNAVSRAPKAKAKRSDADAARDRDAALFALDAKGSTALHRFATRASAAADVARLLAMDARKLDVRDSHGDTAVHARVELKSSTRLQCARNRTVWTRLFGRASRELDESNRFVYKSADSTSIRPSERKFGRDVPNRWLISTQVHAAAATDAVPCLRLLLDAGADATARNAQGFAPLALAASRSASRAAVVLALELEARGLVAAGALDAPGGGYAPLHWACVNDLPDAAATLAARGADAGARSHPVCDSNLQSDFNVRIFSSFDAASWAFMWRTRGEKTIHPKISQNDFDLTELENFKVWSGRPKPAVDSHTGRTRTARRRSSRPAATATAPARSRSSSTRRASTWTPRAPTARRR